MKLNPSRIFSRRTSPIRRLRRSGDVASARHDWVSARKAYSAYLGQVDQDAAIWVQFGHVNKELGNTEEAVSAYRRAIEIAPDESADPHLHLAALLRSLGDHDGALYHFSASAKLGNQLAMREVGPQKRMLIQATVPRVAEHSAAPPVTRFSPVVQAWLGRGAIDGMTTLDIASMSNFRAPSSHHGRYDCVWLHELLLSDYDPSQWRIILDEALRLLRRHGTLKVRHAQNERLSLIALRSYLGRRPGLRVTMKPSEFIEGGLVDATFDVERDNVDIYQDRTWSFVILAQGNRTGTVLAMLDKIEELAADILHEVIIVGPNLPQYRGRNVFVFDKAYPPNHPQIALKKNEAAQYARYANICFMHDRYYISDDFFEGFEKFGYDFDFVGVSQRYETGEPYPFYGELTGSPLIWSVPRHTTNYQRTRPTHFINGGFMVFKREMFLKIQYNPLLAWNEGEDVEVSHQFLILNLPPRLNLYSTAITNVSASHTAVFLDDVSDDNVVTEQEELRSAYR